MKKGQLAIIGIVAVVAVVALILFMQLEKTGDATRTRARRASAPTMSATECEQKSIEFHSATLELKQQLVNYQKVNLRIAQVQRMLIATDIPILRPLTEEEEQAFRELDPETQESMADIIEINDQFFEVEGVAALAMMEKLTALEAEALSIKAKITQLRSRVADVYLSVERCITLTFCPPCPGESEATVQSICLSDKRRFAAAVTQLDVLVVDVLVQWELYRESTREITTILQMWVDAKVAGNDEDIPVFIQQIQTQKQQLIQYQQAALRIHAEFVQLRRQLAIREQEVKACLTRKCPDCEEDSYVAVSQRDRMVSMPREPTQVAVRTGETVTDCESVCAQQGMSTQPPSSASIMQQLNQYVCVSGASIGMQTMQSGQCMCYGQPQINVNTKVPVCNTPCGPVECNSEKQCPCPDKPNCVLTARCTWGGWREIRPYQYKPVIGTV